MPQIRKSSPRRRDRRSRSRSRSPRGRRHSSSRSRDHRSRSRDRRRSRSPQRKRSPERRHRSPPRKRSPSPRRRRSRSRSRSPARKARHSSTPSDRGYIVKRPADSSGKRPGYRSRSPSPVQKRSRDDRSFREESPRDSRRSRRSQSPSTSYGGRMYSDQPSSSKQPLFPAGTSSRKQEIDYVTIVEKGPKREKLDKRFETLEQVAQGAFDFEENITIGIHRGPQHIQLHEDEDIEVNYEFNPKTFKMLFPKKEYHKAIFDRDEIKAFHHDDVLDEEAYVEKRTISIKPVDKPKSRKYGDDFDYKITVGSDREGYGDRRMVHDSGSRSRPSRSSRYEDIPVTVRLDPKPDPRYEKIYKEQQRNEDESLMSERIKRNPNDLRHNLLRRKSDGDRVDRGDRGDRSRDDRGRDDSRREDSRRDAHTLQDARSRIQARREGVSDSRRDRSAPDRSTSDRRRSPPRHDERKKRVTQTSLPDFKNRPGVKLDKPRIWIIGSSVVRDVTKFGEQFSDHNLVTNLKDETTSVEIHGENDMKIEDVLSAVKYMMKTKEHPHMIVIHCGEQNICEERNIDTVDKMKKNLEIIKQDIPNVVLVWSQLLPPWHRDDHEGNTLAKSRRRINTHMMKIFVNDEINGAFLYHPMLRTDKSKFYMPTSDKCLHLNKIGMVTYINELVAGIRYFITGHGSIFPYMKWPMKRAEFENFDPECMCMLNSEHVKYLDHTRLSWLSKEQFQALSVEQLYMLKGKQLNVLLQDEFVRLFSEIQLKGLKKNMFFKATEQNIKVFAEHPERMELLSEDTRNYISKKLLKLKKKNENVHILSENGVDSADKAYQTIGDVLSEPKKLEQTIGDLLSDSDKQDETLGDVMEENGAPEKTADKAVKSDSDSQVRTIGDLIDESDAPETTVKSDMAEKTKGDLIEGSDTLEASDKAEKTKSDLIDESDKAVGNSNKKSDTKEQLIGDLISDTESEGDFIESDSEIDENSDGNETDDWAAQYVGAILKSVEDKYGEDDNDSGSDFGDRRDYWRNRGHGKRFGGYQKYRNFGNGKGDRFEHRKGRESQRDWSESWERERGGGDRRRSSGNDERKRFRQRSKEREKKKHSWSSDTTNSGSGWSDSHSEVSDDGSWDAKNYRQRSPSPPDDRYRNSRGQGHPPPGGMGPTSFRPPMPPMPGMFPPGPPGMPMGPPMMYPGMPMPPMPFPVPWPMVTPQMPPTGPPVAPTGPPAAPDPSAYQSTEKNWGDFPTDGEYTKPSVNTSNLKQIGDSS